jgi:Core-2/I-Branching enzyme
MFCSPLQPAPIQSTLEPTSTVLAAAATPPTLTTTTKKMTKTPPELPKIALLFLTRGPMPLESIWRDFLGVDQNYIPSKNSTAAWQKYFSVYVHTTPGFRYEKDSLFAPFTIDKPVLAEWGGHSIIDAERKLIQAALKDPLNSFFILLSETHVPLYSAAATYLQLATAQRSRVHACMDPTDPDDEERRMTYRMAYEMKLINSGISGETWRKSSQWFGLIRSHAELFAEEKTVNEAFQTYCYVLANKKEPGEYIRFCVSDEHYIPTMLSINKREDECDCDGHVTRVVWIGNFMHPKSFKKEDATMDTLRHELRGEHECRHGRVLERIADKVLKKIDSLLEGDEDGGGDLLHDYADDDEIERDDFKAKKVDVGEMSGVELINYALGSGKVMVMKPSCPLFARKIVEEAESEWRDLLKTVLRPAEM